MEILGLFRAGASKARSRLNEVKKALEIARRELEELRSKPLPPVEFVELLLGILSEKEKAFREYIDRRLENLSREPLAVASDPGVVRAEFIFAAGVSASAAEMALAYFGAEFFRAGLLASAERVIKNPGPPREERMRKLERLTSEITKLEAEERALLEDFEAMRKELEG